MDIQIPADAVHAEFQYRWLKGGISYPDIFMLNLWKRNMKISLREAMPNQTGEFFAVAAPSSNPTPNPKELHSILIGHSFPMSKHIGFENKLLRRS